MTQRKKYSIAGAIDFVTSGDISDLSDLSDDENESNESLDSIPGNTLSIQFDNQSVMSIHLMATTATMMMMIM